MHPWRVPAHAGQACGSAAVRADPSMCLGAHRGELSSVPHLLAAGVLLNQALVTVRCKSAATRRATTHDALDYDACHNNSSARTSPNS